MSYVFVPPFYSLTVTAPAMTGCSVCLFSGAGVATLVTEVAAGASTVVDAQTYPRTYRIDSDMAGVTATLAADTPDPSEANIVSALGYTFAATGVAPVDAVAATGTITDGNASDYDVNQTITINGKVYTFKASLTEPAVEGEVLIGGTADSSLNKLVQAINRNTQLGTPGVDYNVAAAHPDVTAGAVGAHATVLTAKVKGVVGNAITLAKVGAYGSVSGAKLTGGVDGTLGSARDIRIVSSQPYICLADSTTISTGTWKKLSLASL